MLMMLVSRPAVSRIEAGEGPADAAAAGLDPLCRACRSSMG